MRRPQFQTIAGLSLVSGRVPSPAASGALRSPFVVRAMQPADRLAGGPAAKSQKRAGLPEGRSWTEARGARSEQCAKWRMSAHQAVFRGLDAHRAGQP